jgi:hypothetical protein
MTTYGNTAHVIGMYTEVYTGTSVCGHNCDFTYEECDFTRHIIVAKSDLGLYLTIILSHSEGECMSGWTIASYGNLDIEIADDSVIEKITHFPIDNHLIDLKFIKKYNDHDYYCDDYDCDVFEVSHDGGDSYYPCGGYHVNENLFLDFDLKKAKKEFIDTISDELISRVWSPDRISYWINLGSDINLSHFSDSSNFIKV